MSSKSGAADCLEALGVRLDLEPEQNERVLEKGNICFMFAQKYHAAMRFVGYVRKGIGLRTVFNILRPSQILHRRMRNLWGFTVRN